MKVTVLTPSYNRAYILDKLYISLKNQTCKDFKWLIVDDGSTDNTREIIESFIKEKKVDIEYIYQENGGKHRALNNGIKKIDTELTFIVDSDDFLTDDAIETVLYYFKRYESVKELSSISFLRCFPDGKINGEKYKEDDYIASYIDCRINENVIGDKAEVYYTECLRKYPFLEVENEKFLFEDYVWIQLGEVYQTVHVNKAIYVGNYLPDGLTKNMDKVKLNSPIGMSQRGQKLCIKKINFKTRLKGMMIYIAYGVIGKISFNILFQETKYKFLFIISFIPSLMYLIILKKKQKKLKQLIC